MKKSIIWEVFNGSRHFETLHMPKNQNQSWDIAADTYEQLEQQLPPALFELLKKYEEALDSNFCEELKFYFAEAFKLGLLVGIECGE